MYEVEVKVAADLDRVRRSLTELGAADRGSVVQEDTYYEAPHRSFATTDEALRIRRERADGRDSSRVTYKGPLVDDESKTREEVEVEVADSGRMDGVFRNLGFEPAATVRKERERYAVEGYTVTLDTVDGVGQFVEVETTVDDVDGTPTDGDAASTTDGDDTSTADGDDTSAADGDETSPGDSDGTSAGDGADRTESQLEIARAGAYDLLKRLDLDPDDQLRTSYLELLLENRSPTS